MSASMSEALAAYDQTYAATGVPAAAVFAAAQVLNLPPLETLNTLLRNKDLVINWYTRPDDRVNEQMWRIERAEAE